MKRNARFGLGITLVIALVSLALTSPGWASVADAWAGYDAGYDAGYNSIVGAASRSSVADYQAGYDAGYQDGKAARLSGQYGSFFGRSFPYDRFGEDGSNAREHRQVTAELLTEYGGRRVLDTFRDLRWLKPEATAGDFITNVAISVNFSFAGVDDDILNGRGHDRELGAFGLVGLGDRLNLGLGVSHDQYLIDTNGRNYEETVDAGDLVLAYDLSAQLTAGVFVNVSRVDIEDEYTLTMGNPGDSFDRYGAGILASYNQPIGATTTAGLTTAVASLNKHTLGDLFYTADSAWITMLDVNQKLTDWLSVDGYGSYFALLHRKTTPGENTPDGAYWTWGGDVTVQFMPRAKLAVGCSTTAADADRHERRLNTSLTVSF